ncbi:predicted protein [Streptomyces filamentosus NRRL 15998]|uniref:Predicted protein n=1 Tax=Streptomyces filamentosus NRRL 15998 TaxID=457431 RepID=D6AET1_STRFL|nr:predicted protein [Streptomyces filamentosus NRRL 15998]
MPSTPAAVGEGTGPESPGEVPGRLRDGAEGRRNMTLIGLDMFTSRQ